jgi:hypothetical protein
VNVLMGLLGKARGHNAHIWNIDDSVDNLKHASIASAELMFERVESLVLRVAEPGAPLATESQRAVAELWRVRSRRRPAAGIRRSTPSSISLFIVAGSSTVRGTTLMPA